MAKDCKKLIKENIFGDRQNIPEKIVNDIVDAIDLIKKSADKYPELGTYRERVQKFYQNQVQLNEIEKGMKAQNIRTSRANLAHVTQVGLVEDPENAVLSLIQETNKLGNSVRDTLENRHGFYRATWLNSYLAGLEDAGLTKLHASTVLDEEVTKAVYAMNRGENPKGISEPAMKIAEAQHKTNRKILADMRSAGVPVGDLQNFVAPTAHDKELILKAGFDEWATHIRNANVDKDKLYGFARGDLQKETEILRNIYSQVATGKNVMEGALNDEAISDTLKGAGLSKSAGTKLSETRVIDFLDAESDAAYAKKFGGKGLGERTVSYIEHRSRLLGAVSKLGTNPDASIRSLMDDLYSYHIKNDRPDLAKKIKPAAGASGDAQYSPKVIQQFNEYMRYSSIPGNETAAAIGRGVRKWTALSLLGNAGLASFQNAANTAVALKGATGENIMQGAVTAIKGFAEGLPVARRQEWFREAGFFLGDSLQHIAERSQNGFDKKTNAVASTLFKLNGMDLFTQGAKGGYMRNTMMAHAASLESGVMNQATKVELLAAGFKEEHFPFLKSAVQEMPDGRRMLTPEGIAGLDRESVKAQARALKMTPDRFVQELEIKYHSLLASGGNVASSTAGLRETGALNFGTQAGTFKGEMARFFGQFKPFALQAFNITQRVLNSAPDEQMLARGALMSGKKDFSSLGQYLAMGTLMAYMATAMQDLAKGKPPKDPDQPSTWADAMLRSGMGSLYANIVFSDYGTTKDRVVQTIAGPTLAQPTNLLFTANDVAHGKRGNVTKELLKTIRGNIPLQSAPLLKQGVDYLFNDVIQKSVDPGGALRSEQYKIKWDREERIRVGK